MTEAALQIDDLEAAAVDPTRVGGRVDLARRLTDVLCLPEGRMTANERAFAADILATILLASGREAQVAAAERLASVGNVPPLLLRQLLLDAAPVAVPLLTGLTDLPESLAVEAAGVSPDHRAALAARDDTTDTLADALLQDEDSRVVAAVLGKDRVTLSLSSIETLVQRSRNDVAIRAPLLTRQELQPSQAMAMFWWCDARDRGRILSRYSLDRGAVQDMLQAQFRIVFTEANPDPLVKKMLSVIDRRHRPRGRGGEEVTMDVVERTLVAARAMPEPELCEAVGLLAGVGTDTATKVLYDTGGEPFSILCKSVGVSRSAYASILAQAAVIESGGGYPSFDEARREALLACFDTVARDYSRAVLRYWDWRPGSVAHTATVAAAATHLSGPVGTPDASGSDAGGYLGAI